MVAVARALRPEHPGTATQILGIHDRTWWLMRWFTDAAYEGDDDDWDPRVADYSAHLAAIAPRLPPDLAALATDPRFDLHGGRFQKVTVDLEAQEVAMVIECGNLEVGHRLLTLRFGGATIVPDNLRSFADAIGAEFRASQWHQRRTVTEILAQEVDLLPDERFVLRLRLCPFYEFAIEFTALSLADTPLSVRGRARAGTFVVRKRREAPRQGGHDGQG